MKFNKNSSTSFIRDAFELIAPFWRSNEKWLAWILTVAIIGLNLGLVYITVLINQWYNSFYNSLQEKNFEDFKRLILQFCCLAAFYIIGAVYKLYLQQMLTIKWRNWLTASMISEWLKNKRFYSIEHSDLGTDNPDQRISEDIRNLAGATLSLSLGLLSSVTTLISFFLILWNLSGPITFNLFDLEITIPGYMVWAAFLYAGFGSALTQRIGRKLSPLNFKQQQKEADFRYALVKLRENSEAIALLKGESKEELTLRDYFTQVVGNYNSIMKCQKRLTWFTASYGQAAVIFPLVVAAPRYFSGAIQLGTLMQITSAFERVQDSLSWFIDSYTGLTDWKASIDRLRGFKAAWKEADLVNDHGHSQIVRTESNDLAGTININLPNGESLQNNLKFHLLSGKNSVIHGASGRGKSTFFRVLSGLWPFANGSLWMPKINQTMFLSQTPYLPIGTLLDVCCYPEIPSEKDRNTLLSSLSALGLSKFIKEIDYSCDWSKRLSAGEQQRVVLIRAFIKKPSWLFLDEATANLDAHSDELINSAIKEFLPDTTVVRISHKESDRRQAEQILELT